MWTSLVAYLAVTCVAKHYLTNKVMDKASKKLEERANILAEEIKNRN